MFGSFPECPVAANSYTLTGFICQVTLLVLQVVPVLVSLALLFFFWGIATWILSLSSGDEEGAKKGRERTIWGLVALFFILSISGVLAVLMNTFFGGGGAFSARSVPTSAYTQPFTSGASGAVNAPVQVTGSGQVTSREPGFFRSIWNQLGF